MISHTLRFSFFSSAFLEGLDLTEVEFGIHSNYFFSCYDASREAVFSRYYGVIVYLPAVNCGLGIGK